MAAKHVPGPALIYARISKLTGKSDVSFEVQVADCRELARDMGYTVADADVLTERYSGMETSEERGVLLDVRRRIETGKYKALICWKTDRLARTPEELLTIQAHARKHGCRLEFARSPDPNTNEGQLILMILGWAGRQEYDLILERTQAARRSIRDSGQWLGSGQPRDGYLFNRADRSRRRDPDRAPVIELIFRLAASGMSGVRIARLLQARKVPTPGAYFELRKYGRTVVYQWVSANVNRIIKDRTYLGMQVLDRCAGTDEHKNSRRVRVRIPESEWTYRPCDKTDRLVDDATWAAANATIRGKTWNAAATRNEARPFLLRGFLYCGRCGRRLVTQSHIKEPQRSGYRCYSYLKAKQLGTPPCRAACLKRDGLDERLWVEIVKAITDGMIEAQAARLLADGSDALVRADLATARAALASGRRTLANLAASLGDQDGDEVRAAIKAEMTRCQASFDGMVRYEAELVAKLRPYEDRAATSARLREVVVEARRRLDSGEPLDLAARRDMLKMLGFRGVWREDGGVTLQFSTDNDPSTRITCYQKHDTQVHGVPFLISLDVSPAATAIG